jgi:hypothetical protein
MKQPMTGGKSSVAKANGKGKPMRQVETSMSKKYKGTPKVSQATIDSIKKMGMSAALKKAGSSKNVEYIEGVKRMYGAKRVAGAMGTAKKAAAPQVKSPRVAERTAVTKSPRVAERATAKKTVAKKTAATKGSKTRLRSPITTNPKTGKIRFQGPFQSYN